MCIPDATDSRPKANASLALLAAVAGRGGDVTRHLATAFDFSLSALTKLARPPRLAAGEEGEGEGPGGGRGERPRLEGVNEQHTAHSVKQGPQGA